MKILSRLLLSSLAFFMMACEGRSFNSSDKTSPQTPPTETKYVMEIADPTIFYEDSVYYLYGTGGEVDKGFQVYTSTNLSDWKYAGMALSRDDAWGGFGFWAPQVFRYKGQLYMAYTSEEQIAIAKADSPLGPFVTLTGEKLSGPTKQIDPYVFIDDDGTPYLYHVRLSGGNKLYVVELKEDLSDIKPETARLCIEADQPWELKHSQVTEGPTILKHEGMYYFFYSANHFLSVDYAVGYATADNPLGPWTKTTDSPIIHRTQIGQNGTGHGDFFTDAEGNLRYVFHFHADKQNVSPRKTGLVRAAFAPAEEGGCDRMTIDAKSFTPLRFSY